ncbi:MAG: hypothetical protein NTX15_09825 [Candidatus Kapabacteria bacterium]|nr:hypothetical protein [Candidatus Kapabacteria bacterium]
MLHELGHWLGLFHPDETPDCAPGVVKTGIMKKSVFGNENPNELSDQDKCAFMKLYCPTLTSVEWDEIVNDDPNVGGLLLHISDDIGIIRNVECDVNSVSAFDIQGRNLGDMKFAFDASSKRLEIDFHNVSNGPVLVEFNCSGRQAPIRRLFLVQRVN